MLRLLSSFRTQITIYKGKLQTIEMLGKIEHLVTNIVRLTLYWFIRQVPVSASVDVRFAKRLF